MNDRGDQPIATHPTPTREVRLDEHHDVDTPMTAAAPAPIVVDRARGGFSMGSVISGVFVAFGAFIVLSAVIGAILTAMGITDGGISASEARDASIGTGIGLVVSQFIAYLWGGYTAGRMARGAGVLNGMLVAIVALIFVAAVAAIVAAITGTIDVTTATTGELPLPLSSLTDIGTGIGIGLLVAMLLGGAMGGAMGQRWHTKLENAETETATR